MKEVTQLFLESSDCVKCIAKALNIPEKDIVKTKYNFGIENHSAEEIAEKLKNLT